MYSVTRLLRCTPLCILKEYFNARSISLVSLLEPSARSIGPLLNALDTLSLETLESLQSDAERIDEMISDDGQLALNAEFGDKPGFYDLPDRYSRALWGLIQSPDTFQQAENRLLTLSNRKETLWSRFHTAKLTDFELNPDELQPLKKAIVDRLPWPGQIHIEYLLEKGPVENTAPRLLLTFLKNRGKSGQEHKRRCTPPRPVIRICYSPMRGTLDICTQTRIETWDLAELFCTHIIHPRTDQPHLEKHCFDLNHMSNLTSLFRDIPDGISSIGVKRVSFSLAPGADVITLDAQHHTYYSIRELLQKSQTLEAFQNGNSQMLTVKLVIHFYPVIGKELHRRVLPVTLEYPNRSDLKNRTRFERGVVSRLLKEWEVIDHD